MCITTTTTTIIYLLLREWAEGCYCNLSYLTPSTTATYESDCIERHQHQLTTTR